MSINVTVHGNPVRINRGKMVTTHNNNNKSNQKRRKFRLGQVRQQSDDFAETVRQNVWVPNNGEESEQEKGSKKLNSEFLEDIGRPMRSARRLEREETEERQRRDAENNFRAEQRGHRAHELLQLERNEKKLQVAIPRQTRQIAREMENARAAMLVQLARNRTPSKKKKSKKSAANVDSLLEAEIEPEKTSTVTINSNEGEEFVSSTRRLFHSKDSMKSHELASNVNILEVGNPDEMKASSVAFKRSSVVLADVEALPTLPRGVQQETRISDRIRRRYLSSGCPATTMSDIIEEHSEDCVKASEDDKENNAYEEKPTRSPKNRKLSKATHQGVSISSQDSHGTQQTITACPVCLQIVNPFMQLHPAPCPAHQWCYYPPGHQVSVANNAQVQEQQYKQAPSQGNNMTDPCTGPESIEIPQKPMVSIVRRPYQAQFTAQDNSNTEYRQMKCFDWNKRLTSKIVTDKVQLQPVSEQDLVYGELSEDDAHQANCKTNEFSKIADERARMASLRGKQAVERQKAQKDYKTLMQKMPMLRKQDRIAQLNSAKDRFHFSEDRRKEHEKQRQQDLEHAFERILPTSVTIPPRSNPETVNTKQTTRYHCSTDKNCGRKACPKVTQSESKQDETNESGKEDLNQLLIKLKSQKEELLKECKSLPKNSNFFQLIDDLDFSCKGTKPCDDKHVQTESKINNEKLKSTECQSECPVKQLKKVLILQNMSTQTTPVHKESPSSTSSSSSSSSSSTEAPRKPVKTISCTCDDENPLCEILIKVASKSKQPKAIDAVPEVILRPCSTVEDILNLESPQKGPKPERKQKRSAERKRARSESPKKSTSDLVPSDKQDSKRKSPIKPSSKDSSRKSKRRKDREESLNAKDDKVDSARQLNDIVSYTSYYSPPDCGKPTNDGKKRKAMQEELKLSSKVLPYINKLLEMSRKKLETIPLDCDCMNDVPTPTSSVINASSNRPTRHSISNSSSNEDLTDSSRIDMLANMLKRCNLTSKDFQTMISGSTTMSNGTRNQSNSIASTQSEAYVGTPASNTMGAQFTRWSEVCKERINKLSAMIEQVRKEKKEMLQTPDGAQKTSYKMLPDHESSPESPSLEQKQLNAQLLTVNQWDARAPTPNRTEDLQLLMECVKNQPDVDKEVVDRYLKLVGYELSRATASKPTETEEITPPERTFSATLDIPKLPKFAPHTSTTRKPPVTGQALRYNEIFHELSAIPEVESSRLSKSPQSPRKRPLVQTIELDSSENEPTSAPVEHMLKAIGLRWAIPEVRKASTVNVFDNSSSSSSFGTSARNSGYVQNASSSSNQSPACRTSTPVQAGNIPNISSVQLDEVVRELSPVIRKSRQPSEKRITFQESFRSLLSVSSSGTSNS